MLYLIYVLDLTPLDSTCDRFFSNGVNMNLLPPPSLNQITI